MRLWLSLAALLGCSEADADTQAPVFLALGDSFTIGTGSSPAEAFPARMVARWSCAVTLQNLAVNGFTTGDLLSRELPQVEGSPWLVTLAIGANDLVRGASVAQVRQQLERIFDALAARGIPAERVVALPQPAWSRSPAGAAFGEPAELHARITAFNTALREVTTRRGGRWVDLSPIMEAQAEAGMWARDGLHPSAAAHDAWAAALVEAVGGPCPPR